MNFDTGVMSASSLSIGPCASAVIWNWGAPGAPQAPHSVVTAATAITTVKAAPAERASMRIRVFFIVGSLNDGPRPSPVSLRPSTRAIDRASPSVVQRLAPARVDGRREGSLHAPPLRERVERGPHADAEAGEICRTQRRRLDHGRPQHAHTHDIGLELAQEVVGRRATVDA